MALVEAELHGVGALLFRGFDPLSHSEFEDLARWFSDELLNYDFGSTPRTKVSGKVYTSTEYPASQTIGLHNEMAYTRRWPQKLWFYSMKVAEKGGETPIADSRKVYKSIPPEIRDVFETKELMYVRNYRVGMDVPWQKAFNTSEKRVVEEYCHHEGIEWEWKPGNGLRTRQKCQAVAVHPQTHEKVWFNQAHLFHLSNLEPRFREAMREIYREEEFPRNVFFGDGSAISDDNLHGIRQALETSKVTFPWKEGDVLLLDNMLTAHGRNPYEGERKVVVAMG